MRARRTAGPGPGPGRPTRWLRRLAAASLALAVVSSSVAFGREYVARRDRLRDDRETLARALAIAAQAEVGAARLRSAGRELELRAEQARRGSESRAAERDLYTAATELTRADIWDTGVALDRTGRVVEDVLARSREVTICLDGVATATVAGSAGHFDEAAAALEGARRACSTSLAAAEGRAYPFDFPDPFVLAADGAYFAYSTNSGAGDIQVLRSSDLAEWRLVGNALGRLPGWAAPGATWAPSILARPGYYVAYYTARHTASGQQCISRAVGLAPEGPFLDDSAGPLVCRHDLGGSIDASPFVDDDKTAWLVWKNEGAGPEPAAIWSQRLSTDGLSLEGDPGLLLRADRDWEQGVVEGPSLMRDDGLYYLFYSGAGWKTRRYAVGWAACAGPQGPCTKPPGGPLVASAGSRAGPGGQEVFRDASGRWVMAYHAYAEPEVGYPASRFLALATVVFKAGAPRVGEEP